MCELENIFKIVFIKKHTSSDQKVTVILKFRELYMFDFCIVFFLVHMSVGNIKLIKETEAKHISFVESQYAPSRSDGEIKSSHLDQT